MRNSTKSSEFKPQVQKAASLAAIGPECSEARNACRMVAATMFARGDTSLPYGSTGVFQDVLEEATGRRPTSQSMRWYIAKVRTEARVLADAFDFPPDWRELLVCAA